jgi:hypothetical protein
MATIDLGKIKLVWRGTYAGGTAYTVDDVVQHTDSGLTSSFICTTASTGNAPSTGGSVHSSWAYLAKGGVAGTDVGTTLTTQGDVLYRDGSGLQRLAKPASDMYLKNTSAGALSWASLSSDWVKIAHTNITSDTGNVQFVNGTGGVVLDSTYRIYKLIGSYRGNTDGSEFLIRVMNSGTSRTSSYLCEVFRSYYSGGTSRSNSTDRIVRSLGGVQANTGQRGNFEATFFNMFDADHNTTAHCQYCAIDGTGESENQVNNGISSGVYQTPEAHNGIDFAMSAGSVAEGEFTLIGLKG